MILKIDQTISDSFSAYCQIAVHMLCSFSHNISITRLNPDLNLFLYRTHSTYPKRGWYEYKFRTCYRFDYRRHCCHYIYSYSLSRCRSIMTSITSGSGNKGSSTNSHIWELCLCCMAKQQNYIRF